jgi:glycosyltransferase involved in cell wall biosynthesis
MSEIYQHHDVLLVPSTWQETMPRVIQEAMAVGLPTIASSVGGIPEIINHGINGLLFSPGNQTDLAEKVYSIYANPGILSEMKINARKTIEQRFNLETMINELENRLLELR